MTELWIDMGVIRWPLLLTFLAVVALAVRSAAALYGPGAIADLRTRAWVDAVLFWGGFAFLTGVLGTLVGVTIAAGALERLGDIPAGLVWGGMKVALISSVAGMLILALASLAWFGLQLRWRMLLAREAKA